MLLKRTRNQTRSIRQARVRRQLTGTPERPRLNVFKSHRHFFLQVIDDASGKTLVSVSTQEPELKGSLQARGNLSAAKAVGDLVAKRTLAKGINQVVFDRGGFKYHGAVKALAEAARAAGLKF
ncbi:MAG: 50S ribosomal protein L18 [candidate division FCPU426 bacterium]